MAAKPKSKIPEHVAIIMDGNRRWAKQRGLPTLEGHKVGYEKLKEIARYAYDKGVKELSFYVFSTENWNRTKEEVGYLMNLTRTVVKKEMDQLDKENVKIRVAGLRDRVAPDILDMIAKAVEKSKSNNRGVINICFNYGGRPDILEATRKLIRGNTKPEDINEKIFSQALSTAGMRDVDLLIRTSEHRLSGFLPWESVYAEILFLPDMLWPDFSEADFDKALSFFANRARRFGQ